MNCAFCKLDKDRNRIVSKYKYCYVMFSNPRLMPGHLLVIPNRHVQKLSELTSEELKELLEIVIKYQEKLLKHCEGTTIRQNYMPFLPDSRLKITHLHMHIIPRMNKDELYQKVLINEYDIFRDATTQEYDEWIKKLK
jgi:ATP adenylyltransferase